MYHCERGAHFQYNWLASQEGAPYLHSVWPRAQARPLQFALLEAPPAPQVQQQQQQQQQQAVWHSAGPYKIAVIGRAGVGKSEFIGTVTGQQQQQQQQFQSVWQETPGLSVRRQFWPCKLRRQSDPNGDIVLGQRSDPLLCRLDFWEAGDAASRSFEHLRHELRSACDCVLFVFSAADRASFVEVPTLVRRTLGSDVGESGSAAAPPCGVLLVTRLDQPEAQVVSRAELLKLERDCRLPLLRFSPSMPTESVCQLLSRLCECLWHRQLVLQGAIETSVPQRRK